MHSDFSYDRVLATFQSTRTYREMLDIYAENIKTYNDMSDLLDFWKPALVVIDTRLTEFQRMEDLANNHEIPIILFDSDFDALREHINNHFEISDDEDDTDDEIKYIKDTQKNVEKVIVKDRIIEKEIFRTEYTAMSNTLIIVGSLWNGAGSTTLAINLARSIAERGLEVSYVEHPLSKPYMFDYLSIPMKEEERGETYLDVAHEIHYTGLRKNRRKSWKQDGVNWFVTDTRNEPLESFSYEQALQLIYSIHSVITILDVSSNLDNPDIKKLLYHADNVFVCIEPDPVKIDWLASIVTDGKKAEKQRKEYEIMSFLNEEDKNRHFNYELVAMKYSPIIRKDQWVGFLDKEPIAYFPIVNHEDILMSIWESQFLYDESKYNELIEEALKPIIVKILPRDFYSLEKKKKKRSLRDFIRLGVDKH